MSKRTPMSNARREMILEYMLQSWDKKAKKPDVPKKLTNTLVAGLLKQYPQDEMKILEKWTSAAVFDKDTTHIQIQFTSLDTGRFSALLVPLEQLPKDLLVPNKYVSYMGGYKQRLSNQTPIPVTPAFFATFDEWTQKVNQCDEDRAKKRQEYLQFLVSCRTVEAVLDYVKLPTELLTKLVPAGTDVVVISEALREELKKDFAETK